MCVCTRSGCSRPDREDHARRAGARRRARSERARHGTPRSSSARVKAAASSPGVEREEPRVDAPFAQRRQQREQMLLGAADPLHLVMCSTFIATVCPRRPRRPRHHARHREALAQSVGAALAPRRSRSAGSSAAVARRAASASTSPIGARKPVSPSSTTVRVPPASVATTGTPGRERLDRDDGRPSFADVSRNASNARVPGADRLEVAEKPHAFGDARAPRRALHVGPVARRRRPARARVDARSRAAQGADQVERSLDRRQPAGPADDERVRRRRRARRGTRRVPRRRRRSGVRSKP